MNDDFIDMPEDIPTLNSKRCQFIASFVEYFLTYTTYIVGGISLYLYDYFIAILVFILSFIVMGIVRSKVRTIAIPAKQLEFQYTDKDIAKFYTYYEIC